MSTLPFAHLHCHSHYSLLDGAGTIKGLLERAKALRMTALALTDHGNLHGAVKFYQTAKELGINPILGIEAYIAPGSRFHKEGGGSKEASYHLTLLARDAVGFRNLVQLSSAAFLEGFYFKPRIDKELLAAHREGLICLSGCVSSELNRSLLAGGEANFEKALAVAAWFQKLFGNDYYIEIQNNHLEAQRLVMEGAVRVASQLGIPLVATSDVHYVNREDAEAQDILLCVNTGKFRTDTNRMRMETNEFYLRSAEEMYAAFPGMDDALRRTQEIADSVHIELELGKRHFPVYSPPDGKTPEEFLRELCVKGLRERYAGRLDRYREGLGARGWGLGARGQGPGIRDQGSGDVEVPPFERKPLAHSPQPLAPSPQPPAPSPQPLAPSPQPPAPSPQSPAPSPQPPAPSPLTLEGFSDDVAARLERELDVIDKLGFANYFLIVWDFVRFARSQGIQATARGSGVGALVSYALYLSHVCPLEYDLLFERFLDESRREAPDIDIDFCQQRRGEVIQYVKETYGIDNVAQIGTFGTLAARAAIRDVGRALGLPIPRVDSIVALVPDELKITLDKAIEKSDELRKAYDSDPEVRKLLDLAKGIEGLARNVGTHAAAVVIADRPLTDHVPLQHVQDKKEVITQWDMGDVERAGLLKMDFLGLRNLTILSKVVDLIEQTTGRRIDPYQFPRDDKETFALLCRGETKGVFQLESGGIRDLLQRMKPDHFLDIIATNALYRPGPLEGGMVDNYIQVKHGRQQAEYKHPVMKEILAETHGVMVYQEQVMRILNRLGGIKLANAYSCIKAISKKKLDTIAKFREEFVEGAHSKGMSKKEAAELFGLIEKFAGYGFNKSHSTAYALIAYMTAYLKAHYQVEFMAALLSSDITGRNFKRKDSLVEHIEDCQRMDVAVLPPDVNRSAAEFTVLDGKICFGLSAIKGCGAAAANALAAERAAHGPYRSIFDFCERLDPGTVNRAAIEALTKAGAFDSLGGHRSQFFAALDRALQAGAAAANDRRSGQMGLFGGNDDDQPEASASRLPDVSPWDQRERLAKEKEVLGFYLSSHPLAEHEKTLTAYTSHSTVEAAELKHRSEVVLGGMLSAIKYSHTKNPKPGSPSRYAMFDLEDAAGMMRTIVSARPIRQLRGARSSPTRSW